VTITVEIDVSEEHEGTAYPWWAIVDNRRGLSFENKITGPFFSRGAAQEFLDRTRYNFGKDAFVYCFTGVYSDEWTAAVKRAQRRKSEGEEHK
jgi:hypothetical protein